MPTPGRDRYNKTVVPPLVKKLGLDKTVNPSGMSDARAAIKENQLTRTKQQSAAAYTPTVNTVKSEYKIPEYKPGVKHIVEGININKTTQTVVNELPASWRKQAQGPRRGDTRSGIEKGLTKKILKAEFDAKQHNKGQDKAFAAAIADYQAKQKLRQSIVSLPDSEALNLAEKKKQARLRMRGGRQSTMLSQNEQTAGRERLG